MQGCNKRESHVSNLYVSVDNIVSESSDERAVSSIVDNTLNTEEFKDYVLNEWNNFTLEMESTSTKHKPFSLRTIEISSDFWKKRLLNELIDFSNELHCPLYSPTCVTLKQNQNVLHLYDCSDLMNSLIGIAHDYNSILELSISVLIPTPSEQEIVNEYRDLQPIYHQTEIDNNIWFINQRKKIYKKLLIYPYNHFLKKYFRRGVLNENRKQLYMLYLSTYTFKNTYQDLLSTCYNSFYITDLLVQCDVKHTAQNEYYFPWVDIVYNIMKVFSRDTEIKELLPVQIHHSKDNVPLNGILPYKGYCVFCLPLFYIYQDLNELYNIFKYMFIKYWYKLCIISAVEDSSLYLSKSFEDLIMIKLPRVCRHLVKYDVQPLSIAFPWIHTSFILDLRPQEVLRLWDRILGFNSLFPLVILSISIFMLRQNHILECESADDIKLLFNDLREIEVVPLFQYYFVQQ